MQVLHERNLEALIFSDDKKVSARCAEAFSELPVDWVNTEDSTMASQLLASTNFDFVILDLDSPSGTALLPRVRPNSADRQHAVVLAITGGGIDADILEMSYESLIFYPVRPEQICSEVYRALPLAERISKHIRPVAQETKAASPRFEVVRHALRKVSLHTKTQLSKAGTWISKVVKVETRHSLSIVGQERAASLISAAGTIWYVHEITRDWTRLAFLVPSVGPTELIGVAVLLWLCAKQRRLMAASTLVNQINSER